MMKITRSAYYRDTKRSEKEIESEVELRDRIERIHLEFPGYGYRRIREHLLREGYRVNSKRIRRIMKKYTLFSCLKKWLRPRGSAIGKKLTHPNLIAGMKLQAPNQVWSTDITFIKLAREYVYLSAIIDVYTRRVIGWSVSRSLTHEFCLESLKVAIRRVKPEKGVIHHSDRGTQYCSEPYVDFLNANGFRISMSKVATPEDNAFIEAFFKTLKREEIYFKQYQTMRDVLEHLPKFIDEIYNQKRLHSSLGYLPPEKFEEKMMNLKPAQRPVQKIWGKAA